MNNLKIKNKAAPFFKLPDEIILFIFSQVESIKDRAHLKEVSQRFNKIVESAALWLPYLTPEAIKEAETTKTSYSAMLFGNCLDKLTPEGRRLHPIGGPSCDTLYTSLKEGIKARQTAQEKINFLRAKADDLEDAINKACIILSSRYFKATLLNNLYYNSIHENAVSSILHIITNRNNKKVMFLGFQWLFQSETWKTLTSFHDGKPLKEACFQFYWYLGAMSSLDIAYWGLKKEHVPVLEELYSQKLSRYSLIHHCENIILTHKNDKLTLLILEFINSIECLGNFSDEFKQHGSKMVRRIAEVLGLTKELKLNQYEPTTNIIEERPAILIEFIAVLRVKIQSEEEHIAQNDNLTPTLGC